MAELPNTTKECFKEIKGAITSRIASLEIERKVYERLRYADNINQWVDIAAVTVGETVEKEESRLRVIFVYLSDFRTAKKENRFSSITATFAIEVIYGFNEGTDADNSTLDFENELGEINDLFLDEDALGFTDISGNVVLSSPLTGEPDGIPGATQYIDGVLAHRKILTLEVMFRICKGV